MVGKFPQIGGNPVHRPAPILMQRAKGRRCPNRLVVKTSPAKNPAGW